MTDGSDPGEDRGNGGGDAGNGGDDNGGGGNGASTRIVIANKATLIRRLRRRSMVLKVFGAFSLLLIISVLAAGTFFIVQLEEIFTLEATVNLTPLESDLQELKETSDDLKKSLQEMPRLNAPAAGLSDTERRLQIQDRLASLRSNIADLELLIRQRQSKRNKLQRGPRTIQHRAYVHWQEDGRQQS